LAATLSGSWDTDITILPQQTDFNAAISLSTVLKVTYAVGDWSFTSETDLDGSGWTDQDFAIGGVLGAFTISSGLDFVPAGGVFTSWFTKASVSIAGVSFSSTFTLYDNNTTLALTAAGTAGLVSVDVAVNFGDSDGIDGCDLDWAGVVIGVDFPFDCVVVESTITFDCTGFNNIVFDVQGVVIPGLPWLTLDSKLTFTTTMKTLTITPAFNFGSSSCIVFGFDLTQAGVTQGDETANTGLIIQNIVVESVSITAKFGDVTFTGISYLVLPSTAGGYWEIYTIAYDADGCCGGIYGFDLGFYFLEGGSMLFDLSKIDVAVEVNVTKDLLFNMGLVYDLDGAGFTKWIIGFLVTW
jgi:hypothetical protein